MAASIPPLAQARSAFANAQRQVEAAEGAIATHEAALQRGRDQLARLRSIAAKQGAAALLSGAPYAASANDSATIEAVSNFVASGPAMLATLQTGLVARRNAARAAKRRLNAAARAYLTETALEPAKAELAAAWETLGNALARCMAAYFAAEVEFADPQRASLPTPVHGPAAEFITALTLARLPKGHPFDAGPAWLRNLDVGRPDTLPGVNGEVRRLIEDVSAAGELST